MTDEERLSLARDMLDNPEKFGLSNDFLRKWYFNNLENGAEVLDRITESESDRLSDVLIDVYKERERQKNREET